MSKKEKSKSNCKNCFNTPPFGKYNKWFEALEKNCIRNLRDTKSDKNTAMPIKAAEKMIYIAEPDGKLIPHIQNQKKCDFLIYCPDRSQTCFIELKGANISIKDNYNPYNQIIDTIQFLQSKNELTCLVNQKTEKHAFIVSPERQKFPRGIESKGRQLWQKLVQKGMKKYGISDLIHYVKVTKSDRYSNNKQIICSPKSPVPIPFDS